MNIVILQSERVQLKITEHMFNSYSGLYVGHIPQKSFKTLITDNDLQRK